MSATEPDHGEAAARTASHIPGRERAASRSDIDLKWLATAFRRRMWTFVITLAVTVAAFVAFLIFYAPDYKATARVMVVQRATNFTPDRQTPVISALPAVPGQVDSEAQVIASRRVAHRVIEGLRLNQDPEFTGHGGGLKVALSQFFVNVLHAPRTDGQGDTVTDALVANLDPERYLETNAIDVNYTDKDPQKAQAIANAFAQAYLEDQVDAKVQQNRLAASALMSQLDDMGKQAAADSEKVQAYRIAHNLLSVGGQTLTEQEISNYDQAVAVAKTESAADQANLHIAQDQLTKGSSGEDVGVALNSPVVATLRAQRAALTSKLADMEGHYGPKYPDLAQARRGVASIDLEIQAEILRSISNLSAKAVVSQKRLATLQGTLSATKNDLVADNTAQAGLEGLTRAATVSQGIYEAYLQRFKESTAQLGALTPDAEIISMAGLPASPAFPIAWLFLLLSMVVGVLFGCAAVLLAEIMEDRLNTGDDAERKLGLAYLGAIPLQISSRKGGAVTPLDALVARPLGSYAESFRGLMASIALGRSAGAVGVVLVTSAESGDGKSTIAAGLARTSALQGVSTILIDCDLRGRGRGMARDFRLDERGPGLVEVLRGSVTLADALTVDAETGAFLLPMSDDSATSGDVTVADAMGDLLADLRQTYGAVFLDAPAISLAATRLLASAADFTVVVTTWGEPPADGLKEAISMPPFSHGDRIGVVLNRVNPEERARRGFGRPENSGRKLSHHYA